MTVKILDNTIISASVNELRSINLLKLCSSQYDLTTTSYVYEEAKNGFSEEIIKEIGHYIVISQSQNSKFDELLNWLERRFPYLHKGELSSFLLAVLDYSHRNKKYFYITDDGRMRKTIPKILCNLEFIRMSDEKERPFNITGTIGLIKRLREKNCLTEDQIESVIIDLKNSTFYITPSLLSSLRGEQ